MTKKPLPRIAVAQLHSIVGDLDGNLKKMMTAARTAVKDNVDILVFPEQVISGYSIEDLAGDRSFIASVEATFTKFMEKAPQGMTILVGLPMSAGTFQTIHAQIYGRKQAHHRLPLDATDRHIHNTVVLIKDGKPLAIKSKTLLPNYGVYDDARWMIQGPVTQKPVRVKGRKVALAVCEDVWTDDVAVAAADAGAEILLVANASPYHVGKPIQRMEMLTGLAQRTGLTIVYTNMVGGQDEVIYDGGSMIVAPDEGTLLVAPLFKEGVWTLGSPTTPTNVTSWAADDNEQIWEALTTGLRDYLHGTGFTSVIVGLSGGIDCAVAATIAVDALGPDNVWGVGMPGPYSSQGSVDDAHELASNLGIPFNLIPITETVAAEHSIIDSFTEGAPNLGIASENVQARLRSLHIQTLCNAFNMIMLNTGNKSEAAVGYFTLGGDSSGGFAILKDVYKTRVYELAEWRNLKARMETDSVLIPLNSIRKFPSAELAEGQADTDSLLPYPILDEVLRQYLELQSSPGEIVAALMEQHLAGGMLKKDLDAAVLRTMRMVDRAEFKRRQCPIGLKITSRSFTKERRMPIMSRRQHRM